jgi:hypothetical protein
MKAIVEHGDWKAAASLLERVCGRPEQKLEVRQPQSVAEVEELELQQSDD